MEQLVTSEFKLGIIAGGQLGKMLVLAASNWDIKTYVLDKDDHCPASACCTHFIKGDNLDFDDVVRFGRKVDMITFEIENINIDALKFLASEGKRIFPDPGTLEIIQNKGSQKKFFAQHNIPSPDFRLFNNKLEIEEALLSGSLQFPFVQKLCQGGYDGRGVAIIRNKEDMSLMLEGVSVVERLIQVENEISVIVARNTKGEVQCFPVVEMEFNEDANLVEKLVCPSSLAPHIESKAKEIAITLINAFQMQGILAVEMFVDKNEFIWVNEVAPRAHNSGHHTIESIATSQFEQLLRAIFNFPLGSTMLKMPAVMVNILGEPGNEGLVKYEGLMECMQVEGVKIHLYGKKITRPYRKMGHATILAKSVEEARMKADIVKQNIKVKAW